MSKTESESANKKAI